VKGNVLETPGPQIKSKKRFTPKVLEHKDSWERVLSSPEVWDDAMSRSLGHPVLILQEYNDGIAHMQDGVMQGKIAYIVTNIKVAVIRITDELPSLLEEANSRSEYLLVRGLKNDDHTVPHRFRPYGVESFSVFRVDTSILPGLHWVSLISYDGSSAVRPFYVSGASLKDRRRPLGIRSVRSEKEIFPQDMQCSTDIAKRIGTHEMEVFGRRWNPKIDSWLFT